MVRVRTRGLWGSMFSYAQTGEHPNLIGRYAAGLGYLIANLLLFAPRRKVDITIERVERGQLPELRRETLNPWLEAWYNDNDGPETPTYIPYHFAFGRRTFEFPKLQNLEEVDASRIKPEIREAVTHMISDKLGRPLTDDELKTDTTFDQLGLDSLDRMELNLHVEQRYGFTSDQVPTTLGQLWALAQGLVEKGPPKPPPADWFAGTGVSPVSGSAYLEILGDTIAEAFVAPPSGIAQRGRRRRPGRRRHLRTHVDGSAGHESAFRCPALCQCRSDAARLGRLRYRSARSAPGR